MVFLSTTPPARPTSPKYPNEWLAATTPDAGGQPSSMHERLSCGPQDTGMWTIRPQCRGPLHHVPPSSWGTTGPAQHSTNLRGGPAAVCPAHWPLNPMDTTVLDTVSRRSARCLGDTRAQGPFTQRAVDHQRRLQHRPLSQVALQRWWCSAAPGAVLQGAFLSWDMGHVNACLLLRSPARSTFRITVLNFRSRNRSKITYHQSWLTREVPSDWKLDHVTPIYKKGWKEDPGN